jgi:hypothetical protein
MDTSERPEVLRETSHVTGNLGKTGADAMPRGPRSNEWTPPHDPAGPTVPDEGAFDSFVDGSGI